MPEAQLQCLETPCAFCGALLEVSAAALAGEPSMHQYTCPECGKPDEMACSGNPHVRVLRARNDGGHKQYQQTMF